MANHSGKFAKKREFPMKFNACPVKVADPNGFEPSASAFGAPSFLADKGPIAKVSAGFSLLNCTDSRVVWRGFER